jgi:DNA invertase Pin-like site-specific DNA recombinase
MSHLAQSGTPCKYNCVAASQIKQFAMLRIKHLGRPVTLGKKASQIRKLYRGGVSKAEIARHLDISRTSVRRIPASLVSRPRS